MLHNARRTLFMARSSVLRARVYGKGTSAWQANWYTEQNQNKQDEYNLNEAKKRETMKKVSNTTNADYEALGENWGESASSNMSNTSEARRDSPSLWERAKGAAQAMKDTVSDKVEAAKETVSEKYEDAKEAMGDKMDSMKDSMKDSMNSRNDDKNLSRTQPLGTTYTKVDSSRKGMNAEVPLTEMQGNLSPDDEILSNMAAKSGRSNAFHSKDNLYTAASTEDLTLKDQVRDDKAAAAEHRKKWEVERKLRNVTENDADDFLEPDYVVPKREQQNLTENLKDTAKATSKTWDKAGNSMMKGLDKTAKNLQSE